MGPQSGQGKSATTYPCRHCGEPVIEHEMIGVWQHLDDRWRCADRDTLAEPKRGPDDAI